MTVAALAARAAAADGDDPVILAVPADHLIADREAFGVALAEALTHAARGNRVWLQSVYRCRCIILAPKGGP
ncbi:hypothetical protein FVF58_40245 [Paraburkholderia panacisoli]|uniref:Nucleotidyl transferase domain-containing protein n=1 Tax=Paraburkholderia panacisoli TaxID=2603818 RepID=A0A5B0GB82_9BURK|nr:hypothetical protein FVF58_40245 [Paraburkholderia panacisoli]